MVLCTSEKQYIEPCPQSKPISAIMMELYQEGYTEIKTATGDTYDIEDWYEALEHQGVFGIVLALLMTSVKADGVTQYVYVYHNGERRRVFTLED